MAFPDEIKALETELNAAGVSVDALLVRASVDRSSWTRWKKGSFRPRMDSWAKVQAAAKEMIPNRAVAFTEAATEAPHGAAA